MTLIKVDGRHGKWLHPFATMMGLWFVICVGTIVTHDFIVARSSYYNADMSEVAKHTYHMDAWIAYFFLAYVFIMVGSRYLDCGSYIFYETVWCCNSSLLLASYGILTNRPLLIGASIAGVCCDQVLWYVDCAWYLLLGKFKVGVAKYLIWPETSWSKKYLCTHHLWFMPLALYVLGWHFPPWSFILSCVFTSLSTCLCRFTTPKYWKDEYNGHVHYMNVNAGHEFWKDAAIPVLHMFDRSPAIIYLTFMVVCANAGLNGPPYLLLNAIMS